MYFTPRHCLVICGLLFIFAFTGCNNSSKQQQQPETGNPQPPDTRNFNPNHTEYLVSRTGIPDESHYASSNVMVGLDLVEVEYYSRDVSPGFWQEGFPYNTPWIIGHHKPIELISTSAFYVDNSKTELPAGAYWIYAKVKDSLDWTLLFNKIAEEGKDNTGTLESNSGYDSTKTLLAIPVKGRARPMFHEELLCTFRNTSFHATNLFINLGAESIDFTISFDNTARIFANIDSTLNESKTKNGKVHWDEYYEAAEFCLLNSMEDSAYLEQGLEWANRSIADSALYLNYDLKAQILARYKNYKEALALLDKAENELKKDGEKNKLPLQHIRRERQEWLKIKS
jgi:hypothetical protein